MREGKGRVAVGGGERACLVGAGHAGGQAPAASGVRQGRLMYQFWNGYYCCSSFRGGECRPTTYLRLQILLRIFWYSREVCRLPELVSETQAPAVETAVDYNGPDNNVDFQTRSIAPQSVRPTVSRNGTQARVCKQRVQCIASDWPPWLVRLPGPKICAGRYTQ